MSAYNASWTDWFFLCAVAIEIDYIWKLMFQTSVQILLSFTFPFHYPLEYDILRNEGVFNVGLFSTVISTPATVEQSMATVQH